MADQNNSANDLPVGRIQMGEFVYQAIIRFNKSRRQPEKRGGRYSPCFIEQENNICTAVGKNFWSHFDSVMSTIL